MLDLVFRARFRWKLWPRQITSDTTYGTTDNIVVVEDQHMRAYVPLPQFDKRTSVYGKQAFRYDPERDVYVCPNNAILPLQTHAYNEREKRYQQRCQERLSQHFRDCLLEQIDSRSG